MKTDVYQKITARIVAALREGVRPWLKPWSVEYAAERITRPLRANGVPYQGVNVLMLWSEAMDKGFVSPFWMSFKQAIDLGACVRKGEHGSLVVYADCIRRTKTNAETGDDVETEIPFLRGYTVFNVEQVEGLPEHFYAKPAPRADLPKRNARAEAFFAATRADIRHGGNRAAYVISQDRVMMPPFEAFHDVESYYATLVHEICHWTRHPSRLDREFGRKRFGDEGYAMEELVAELGSAFLCADLDLTPEVREDHAAYIDAWLTVLQRDHRAIFTAAHHAQRAVDCLHSLQPAAAEMRGGAE